MKKSLFSAITIAFLYSSCSDGSSSEQLLDDSTARQPMTFSVSQEPLSRAVTFLENAAQMEQFYVVAQVKDGTQDKVYANLSFYRDVTETNKYTSIETIFWPNDSREAVTFYAVNFGPNDKNYLSGAILSNNDITPIRDHSIEIPVDDTFSQDLVAAYSVTSANQTTNGVAPLVFKHMLAEVEVYVKVDNPASNYMITSIVFESEDNTRIYHFDTNTWSTGANDQKIREVYYFRSNGFDVTNTNDYVEVVEAGSTPGFYFKFMIPGNYTLRVIYSVPTTNDPINKTCEVTLLQNQKNRINLTLTPPVN